MEQRVLEEGKKGFLFLLWETLIEHPEELKGGEELDKEVMTAGG